MLMVRKNVVRVPLSLVLSLLLLVDFSWFNVPPVKAADAGSIAIGAGVGVAAGAGLVLAGPAIATAVGAAGAGIMSLGTAIVGGLAAAGAAMIAATATVGTAIAGAVGALGGMIVGVIASPLFVPALIIIGILVAGYLIGRWQQKRIDGEVIPGSEKISVTPADLEMNPLVPSMTSGVKIGDADAITLPGKRIASIGNQPITQTPQPVIASAAVQTSTIVTTCTSEQLKAAEDRYRAAYSKYTQLVTTGGSGDVQNALREYRDAYREYSAMKAGAVSPK
ncbi:MAG: hypothetical protein HQM08_17205 [Candidatus Riflebacteria bacterium]|nr:hypothetical protein [Candidatus Riflebacteria bacterium]